MTPVRRTWALEAPDGLQVRGGQIVRPYDLRPGDIDVDDVAHSLANTCRFTGHLEWHYSVAQHCCYVSDRLWREPVEIQLAGLLHDSPEYVLGDMAGPTKKNTRLGREYRRVEGPAEAVCELAFGLPAGIFHDPRVKDADVDLQIAEAKALLPPHEWHNEADPALVRMIRKNRWAPVPEMAKYEFMARYLRLARLRKGKNGHTATA